jgi:hypothetical protein
MIRTTRLIWIFGVISSLFIIPGFFEQFVRGNSFLGIIWSLVSLVILVFSLIAEGGLSFLINQSVLNNKLTFTDVWLKSRSKLINLVGLAILITPAILLAILINFLIAKQIPTSPISWLAALMTGNFCGTLFIFGVCAVVIDEINAASAAWTSLLITLNNFFWTFLFTGILFIVRMFGVGLAAVILFSGLFHLGPSMPLAFDTITYQNLMTMPVIYWTEWIINLLLYPLASIGLTLAYLKFTKDISYPALSKRQKDRIGI